MSKVLLIDDDVELLEMLTSYLEQEDFIVKTVVDGEQGVNYALQESFDIVVLDVMMPVISGIEVLQRIRKTSLIPVLLLTARGDNIDRIQGLNLGADDYVSKPCSPGELVARIRAILRRTKMNETLAEDQKILVNGALTLYTINRKVTWDNQPLELTGAEFNLLEVLIRHAGQLVNKNDLSMHALGRPLTPFDRRIDVHLSSVRQKLGLRPDGQSRIQNVRGQGYLLLQE